MRLLTVAVVVLSGFTALGLAEEKAKEKESATPILRPERTPKTGQGKSATDASLSDFTVFKNLTIPAGRNKTFIPQLDYTGADHAAISITCPVGNSLKNIQIIAWWGTTLGDLLTATNAIFGSDMLFNNMGGGTVPVFGSQLQLELRNVGTTDVSCDQLTVYAVVH